MYILKDWLWNFDSYEDTRVGMKVFEVRKTENERTHRQLIFIFNKKEDVRAREERDITKEKNSRRRVNERLRCCDKHIGDSDSGFSEESNKRRRFQRLK